MNIYFNRDFDARVFFFFIQSSWLSESSPNYSKNNFLIMYHIYTVFIYFILFFFFNLFCMCPSGLFSYQSVHCLKKPNTLVCTVSCYPKKELLPVSENSHSYVCQSLLHWTVEKQNTEMYKNVDEYVLSFSLGKP